jgi:membrane-associated phospholipid phosphatase
LYKLLKSSKRRADGSNNLSFPSGHTAIAFTNATLLFQEYKDSNFGMPVVGLYLQQPQSLCIANNKHYSSDVLAGAGIDYCRNFSD